jgi:hypothetical protein
MTEGRRPPKAISDEEFATILAYAERHTDAKASEQFGVSTRTIQRKRHLLREGKAPRLAALFAKQKKVERARCEALLNETYAKVLRKIAEKLDTATFYEACGAAKILGDAWVAKKALLNDDEPRADLESPEPEEAQDAAGAGAPATH